MKKLFVSFSSLLREVGTGSVTPADLQQGLFFFGCMREHALDPGAAGEADERAWNKGKFAVAYPLIKAALLEAEKDGRAAWHKVRKPVDGAWRVLDNLLGANGFSPLQHRDYYTNYCYPGVRDLVAERGLALEVVY
jgi:hypothetical protein